ncbi:MAG: multicopper oxidase domain-containing protein [Nitrospira sp.]|nr:multicopper oxidase domain-containing protein [Nitrospira sp.]
MKQRVTGFSAKSVMRNSAKACLLAAVALTMCMGGNESAHATTGGSPYEVPQVKDGNADPNIVETWIVADEATNLDIGGGVMANGMAFKSCSDMQLSKCTTPGIPGPEFRLTVGNRVIVHFVNKLNPSGLTPEANVSGIHWHGIELNNASDGTELTQPAVAPGGSFTYDFIVSRPGIFWYHPHHHSSTNQVAKGLYGSIIIEDNRGEAPGYEQRLQNLGVIPSTVQTKTLVLSDITVCNPGNNPATYADGLPHVSGISSTGLNKWQINYENHDLTQSPRILCDTYPLDANGKLMPAPYGAGDVPNIQSPSLTGRMSEGFTVLTNGVNVGPRGGTPDAPEPLDENKASTLGVQPGQGLRLQIVNPSPVRYMRLRLTGSVNGIVKQIDLVRIGGQGGLLNNAVVEGGIVSGFDTKYGSGEILLPPAGRADVVAAIPGGASGVLTLWQEDFQRVLDTWSWTPTVPVMHLKVNGSAGSYSIGLGTGLLSSVGASVPALDTLTGNLDLKGSENGSTNPDIQLTFWTNIGAFEGSIDGVPMPRDFTGLGKDGLQSSGNPFYLASSRHAALANTMELTVTNTTGAHHPFHLHGFSFQPKRLTSSIGGGSYSFPYNEFVDILDVPAFSTLTFRVSLADRPTMDKSVGGGLGRWLFHCHILPHATFGMMSELHVHKK